MAVVSLSAGCGLSAQKSAETVAWSAAEPQPTVVPLAARKPESSAPLPSGPQDFALQTIDGDTFRLSEQRGHVVGLVVMASWCETCIPQMQAWERLATEDGPRGLRVVAVSGDPGDTPDELRRFAALAKAPDPIWLLDPKAEFVRLFQVRSLDTTLIFDRAGQVVYRSAISAPHEALRREVEKVL